MEDFNSDTSSVTNCFSSESSSIFGYNTETCDSLIAGFEQCKVIEENILSPQCINTQKSFEVSDLSFETVSNNDYSNASILEKNSVAESSQERSLSNKHTDAKITHEVGVNTDRSYNYKVTRFRKPYFKFNKHLNQYRNFKRTHNNYNSISKKQQKTMNNYRNHNRNYGSHNRWQFQNLEWQKDRVAKAFHFFIQMMKCFNQRF